MDETVLISVGSHLVKVVHVQLNKRDVYLPDEGGVLVVFEVLGEYGSGELSLIQNHKPNPRWCPFDDTVVDGFLGKQKATSSIS